MELSALIADSLLHARSDAIVAADRDGIIRLWNPGAERIFGRAAADAIGNSLDLIVPERLRERHWQGYHGTITTGNSRYGEGDVLAVPALHKSGATISIEFTILPLRDTSRAITAIVALIRDVTKRFEEIRQLKRRLAKAPPPRRLRLLRNCDHIHLHQHARPRQLINVEEGMDRLRRAGERLGRAFAGLRKISNIGDIGNAPTPARKMIFPGCVTVTTWKTVPWSIRC